MKKVGPTSSDDQAVAPSFAARLALELLARNHVCHTCLSRTITTGMTTGMTTMTVAARRPNHASSLVRRVRPPSPEIPLRLQLQHQVLLLQSQTHQHQPQHPRWPAPTPNISPPWKRWTTFTAMQRKRSGGWNTKFSQLDLLLRLTLTGNDHENVAESTVGKEDDSESRNGEIENFADVS
jgi:hypothetical protein